MNKVLVILISVLSVVSIISITAPAVEAEEIDFISNGAEQVPDIYKIRVNEVSGNIFIVGGSFVTVDPENAPYIEERLRNKDNINTYSDVWYPDVTELMIYVFDYLKDGTIHIFVGYETIFLQENQLFMRSTVTPHYLEAGQAVKIKITGEYNGDLRFGICGSEKYERITNTDSRTIIKGSGENEFFGSGAYITYAPTIFISYSITPADDPLNIAIYGYVSLIFGIAIFAIFTFFGVKRKMEDQ